MGEKRLKIVFVVLATALLPALLAISRDAGISGDEEVHYKQSEMVYSYFSTWGNDKSAVDTPKTHLQYYGQAFDNLTTALAHWFKIEDIYQFRHLMCSFAGWLTILVTALFAAHFSGYGAGILALILFAASPTFLGHAQNNLKDIPFALGYIASTFYAMKLAFDTPKPPVKTIVLLVLSIALSIGIRPGGLLVLFYLGLFLLVRLIQIFLQESTLGFSSLKKYVFLFSGISLAGYFFGVLFWPYALQNPMANVWKSYEVMTHFPTTVRQIFEGNFDWSDFHPWYYLPKYMGITIPLIIWAGVGIFLLNCRKSFAPPQSIRLGLVGFTILFPLAFVVLKSPNLYGSWRHFLFIYPGIVLVSALGFHSLFLRFQRKIIWAGVLLVIGVLAVHPVRFMTANHPYYYLYYNQLVGGLKGAYGKYETDYYYHTMREGAEWLRKYLPNRPGSDTVVVGSNFPVDWHFRNEKGVKLVYFPYQSRSAANWDFAIVANSYISPELLERKNWPPSNTIHTIYADGVPVCAVIERVTKDDFLGISELKKGEYIKSSLLLEKALIRDPQNELICYKFAESMVGQGRVDEAGRLLDRSLALYPGYDQALALKGDLELKKGNKAEAVSCYEQAIRANRKFFAVYPKLAAIYSETNEGKARQVLAACLRMHPGFKPALQGMADSYRKTNPEIAEKYDKWIKKLE